MKNLCDNRGRGPISIPTAHGFTLMEVLVAFAILSVMLSAIIQSHSETIFFMEKTGRLEQVQKQIANELFAIERGKEVSDNASEVFPADHPLAGARWSTQITSYQFLQYIPVEKVSYRITWGKGENTQYYESYLLR